MCRADKKKKKRGWGVGRGNEQNTAGSNYNNTLLPFIVFHSMTH